MQDYNHYKHNLAYLSGSGCSPCHITKHQEVLTLAPGSLPCLRRGLSSSRSVQWHHPDNLAWSTHFLPVLCGARTCLCQHFGQDHSLLRWGRGALCMVGWLAAPLVSIPYCNNPNCPPMLSNVPWGFKLPGLRSNTLEV